MNDDDATRQFYDLIWPHRAAVVRTAQILTGTVHEAEDLAQETFIKAYRALHQFDPATSAKAWLMTILRNARIDRLRSSKRFPQTLSLDASGISTAAKPDEEFDEEIWTDPAAMLEQFSDQEIIHALQRLDEDVRWTLLLVDVEGLGHADAAAILDVPVGTIKSRAHRGRKLLREALSPVAKERGLISSTEREVQDERD